MFLFVINFNWKKMIRLTLGDFIFWLNVFHFFPVRDKYDSFNFTKEILFQNSYNGFNRILEINFHSKHFVFHRTLGFHGVHFGKYSHVINVLLLITFSFVCFYRIALGIYINSMYGLLSLFNGISTLVGYLMPKPSL